MCGPLTFWTLIENSLKAIVSKAYTSREIHVLFLMLQQGGILEIPGKDFDL